LNNNDLCLQDCCTLKQIDKENCDVETLDILGRLKFEMGLYDESISNYQECIEILTKNTEKMKNENLRKLKLSKVYNNIGLVKLSVSVNIRDEYEKQTGEDSKKKKNDLMDQ